MKVLDLRSKFKNEHTNLEDLRLKVISAQEEFEDAQEKAKCASCEIEKVDAGLDLYERYQNCKLGLRCGKAKKSYQKYIQILKQMELLREEYAQKVFSVLSIEMPDLMERREKKRVSWKDAFPKKYSDLDEGQRNSVLALVEEVGGKYRIIES